MRGCTIYWDLHCSKFYQKSATKGLDFELQCRWWLSRVQK